MATLFLDPPSQLPPPPPILLPAWTFSIPQSQKDRTTSSPFPPHIKASTMVLHLAPLQASCSAPSVVSSSFSSSSCPYTDYTQAGLSSQRKWSSVDHTIIRGAGVEADQIDREGGRERQPHSRRPERESGGIVGRRKWWWKKRRMILWKLLKNILLKEDNRDVRVREPVGFGLLIQLRLEVDRRR